jgi:hypothetical protein
MSYGKGVSILKRELASIERSVADADPQIRGLVGAQIGYSAPDLIRATRSGNAGMLRSTVAELRDRISVLVGDC